MGYVPPAAPHQEEERSLHRSTLWRLVGYLGALTIALTAGMRLWEQHDPLSSLHRFQGSVPPRKYRSPPRAETLRHARRLLELRDRWDRTFAEKFFPRFATRARPP